MDSAFKKITGKTKAEFDKDREKEHLEYEERKRKHKEAIPELTNSQNSTSQAVAYDRLLSPVRIQRSRKKGFKMPENTIYVGRGTKWGNPLKLVGDMIYIDASYRRKKLDKWVFYTVGDIYDIVYLYDKLFDGTKFQNKDLQYWADKFRELNISELKGKNLACWCSLNSPCHADVLLRLSNR